MQYRQVLVCVHVHNTLPATQQYQHYALLAYIRIVPYIMVSDRTAAAVDMPQTPYNLRQRQVPGVRFTCLTLVACWYCCLRTCCNITLTVSVERGE